MKGPELQFRKTHFLNRPDLRRNKDDELSAAAYFKNLPARVPDISMFILALL